PGIDQAPVIAKRRTELAQQYQDVTAMLNEGRIDDAWQAIATLQVTLAQLIRDNAQAGTAAATRSQYQNLVGSVSKRLQGEEEFAALGKLADLAEQAWTSGDWKQTNMLFGQAMQALNEWLETNEAPEERIARTRASEERIAALETEQDRLRGEINRITAERGQHELRAKELDKRIADITVERVDAMGDLKATRESLTQEKAKRSAAEKLAQERADLLTQLNAEKAGLEQRNQQLQEKSAELDQVERELAQAKEQAKSLAEQLAAAQKDTIRWKKLAESTSRPATSTAVSPKWQAMVCVNSIGMQFRLIPAGSFKMGGSQSAESLAKEFDFGFVNILQYQHPQHEVRISQPFYLGVHEVTVGQFRQFVNATGYETEAEKGVRYRFWTGSEWLENDGKGATTWAGNGGWKNEAYLNWKNPGFSQTEQHPVVCLSYNDAMEFLTWLSGEEDIPYDFPTEAQWEYACRAGTITRFPFGDDVQKLAVYGNVADGTLKKKLGWLGTVLAEDGYVYTAPVGAFAPNIWGLHDMLGNANEWTKDWLGEDYYAISPGLDPTGPATGAGRVFRGGSWYELALSARPAYRGAQSPETRLNALGFRVACHLSSE
ncbi:MAG: SUMF1/EgtB/PvdO family nonheme iron enzyme, partial [Planctomycetes bacterium]|nr:SUMF1/EgtB/PvdO family nonheme iron enzyme [Planctomycetota bacterium]